MIKTFREYLLLEKKVFYVIIFKNKLTKPETDDLKSKTKKLDYEIEGKEIETLDKKTFDSLRDVIDNLGFEYEISIETQV